MPLCTMCKWSQSSCTVIHPSFFLTSKVAWERRGCEQSGMCVAPGSCHSPVIPQILCSAQILKDFKTSDVLLSAPHWLLLKLNVFHPVINTFLQKYAQALTNNTVADCSFPLSGQHEKLLSASIRKDHTGSEAYYNIYMVLTAGPLHCSKTLLNQTAMESQALRE